ncbi:hypothetical protein QBC44DRAFT_311420 [Cladorrhinum sp. PSN332]|nr:hypothetical protein QBC44DRAFT_311420 [Cladorrhinum sp. PSN332]
MGGKVWSEREEKHFWRYCVPRSHKRVKRDQHRYEAMTPEARKKNKFEIMEWHEVAEEMMRWATRDGGVARRNYTYLSCFEHFYLNVCDDRATSRSPNIGGMATPYIKEYQDKKDKGLVDTTGDPTGFKFGRKIKVKHESDDEKKPAPARKTPHTGAAERRAKKMKARRGREQPEEDEEEAEGSGAAHDEGDAPEGSPKPNFKASLNPNSASGSGAGGFPHPSPHDAAATNVDRQPSPVGYGVEVGAAYALEDRAYYSRYASRNGVQDAFQYDPAHPSHKIQHREYQLPIIQPRHQMENHSHQYSHPYVQHQYGEQQPGQHQAGYHQLGYHQAPQHQGYHQPYNAYYDTQAAIPDLRSVPQSFEPIRCSDTSVSQRHNLSSQVRDQSDDFTANQAAAALVAIHRHDRNAPTGLDPASTSTNRPEERHWVIAEPTHDSAKYASYSRSGQTNWGYQTDDATYDSSAAPAAYITAPCGARQQSSSSTD